MNTENPDSGLKARKETYNRLYTTLEIGCHGAIPDEEDIADFVWKTVLSGIDWKTAPPMALLLAEEALVLRMTAARLLRQFQNGALMKERKTGTDILCPTVESWTKIQEKFRKVMKELLDQYGEPSVDGESTSLAASVQPPLKKGEVLLDGLLSVEKGARTIEELWDDLT